MARKKIEVKAPDWKQEFLRAHEELCVLRARNEKNEENLRYIAYLEDENKELREQLRALWGDKEWQ